MTNGSRRRHHERKAHEFFYCTICFARFLTKEERKAHDSLRCNNIKCVTLGCVHYGTFSGALCQHSALGKRNSPLAIWIALFQIARPFDEIPDLDTVEEVVIPFSSIPYQRGSTILPEFNIIQTKERKVVDQLAHHVSNIPEPGHLFQLPALTPARILRRTRVDHEHGEIAEMESVPLSSPANSPVADSGSQEDHVHTEYPAAPTMTDEGYQSMDKQQQVQVDEEDAVSDADSVRTDNRESGLSPSVKDRLSSYFAQELLDSLRLAKHEIVEAIDRICSSLPDLLLEYSTLMGSHARPGAQEHACIFVRHQRK